MIILIVNCFKSDENFNRFRDFILSVMTSSTISLLPDNIDVIVRKANELSDVTFDYDRSMNELYLAQQYQSAETLFDKIDFVFVDSDYTNYMPWHLDNEPFVTLMKNCMRSRKCVFGSHAVFNTVIYLQTLGKTRSSQKLYVVNNK